MSNIASVTKFSAGNSLTSTTSYTYEPRFNQVLKTTDPNGYVTLNNYGNAQSNPSGNLVSTTYPATAAGTAIEYFTYNNLGEILTDTAPDGTVTQNIYDSTTGYLSQTVKDYGTGKLNATTKYTYDAYGHVATLTDPNGNVTTTTTDAMDHVTEIDRPSGEVEQKTYDGDGRVLVDQKKVSGSTWEKSLNVYNTYDQLTATRQYTDGTNYLETDYGYDVNGNRTTVTDPLGHTTTTVYDERNKPYLFKDALTHTVQYDFDGEGNKVKLTDELGNVTTYVYDGLNRLVRKNFPDASYQTWSYDLTGNITGMVTTAGNSITQTYDARNRMITQVYGSTITNAYDIMGRLVTSTEGGTALHYVYDDLGRNTSFTDQAGLTSTYSYDLVGNRTSASYPSGVTVKRTYDASNRLLTLKDGSSNTQATTSYDLLDRETAVSLANGTSVSYAYDLLSRLSSLGNTLGGTTTRNYSYVYNAADQRTSENEPRGTIGYGYSARNELTGITEPTGSPFSGQSFVYDPGYNRSSWTRATTTENYTVNNLDQYTVITGETTPTWNSDGGLATYGGGSYHYDALRRLTEVDNSSGKYLFSYDPTGRRVKKVIETTGGTVLATYSYHYDGSEVAVEYRPSTTSWTYYLGVGADEPVLRVGGTTKQWYYRDGEGSISAVTDNSGNVLEQYEYNAQGQFQITTAGGTVQTGTQIGNDVLYDGYRYDPETANYFCNARYYNPALGRFVSRDPLSGAEFSQGTNLYAYCGNDYPNRNDPTGESWEGAITGVLDAASLIPVVQEVTDPINAVISLSKGDYQGAGLSIAGMVPGFGEGADVARAARDAERAAGDSGKIAEKTAPTYEEGVKAAAKAYPEKAGKTEAHHIEPKYLGGDPKGPTVKMDAAYHQQITNAFRDERGYGKGPASAEEQQGIAKKVYSKFPLPTQ